MIKILFVCLLNSLIITAVLHLNITKNNIDKVISEHIILGSNFAPKALCYQYCMTASEYAHLQDVSTRWAWLYMLLPAANIGLSDIRVKLNNRIKTVLAVIVISLLILALGFNQFFILFHQIIFPYGNWSFESDSVLIQTYPPGFWLNIFCIYIVIFLVYVIVELTKRYKSSTMKK